LCGNKYGRRFGKTRTQSKGTIPQDVGKSADLGRDAEQP